MRPEQQRALAYLRRRGTEAPVAAIRERLAATFQEIEEQIATIDQTTSRKKPAPGKWSVLEVVDHLVETNRLAVHELEALLQGRAPAGGPIPAGLQSSDPGDMSFAEHREALHRVHEDLKRLLDGATDDVPLTAKAPLVMVVKVETEDGRLEPVEWIEELDWKAYATAFRAHTLEHVRQIERTLT